MKVIDIPLTNVSKTANVEGAFTFLSAGDLIYQLETALELVETAKAFEMIKVSVRIRFLDVKCKKILFNYMEQIESVIKNDLKKEVVVEWRYEWFDDDMIEMGQLLDEFFEMKLHYMECERLSVI